ncbi:hypothetical protein HPC49_36115 [Pyxidicoccus fallax]|uniref:Uncharacterized protein n=1 Tax=Pyxidicoccus fallax TaxID=394095 RepID=A0A848LVP5_9BACT|nr:hypothetical protein [Pyxidicoccus fallax]NMO22137.1 hypothetical protein [Pyxidicoccus fallax]NPC83637.1 hypothetical protein [Pyxidicoccus fallax]
MVSRKKKSDSVADREQFVLRTAEALRAIPGVVSVTPDVADQVPPDDAQLADLRRHAVSVELEED